MSGGRPSSIKRCVLCAAASLHIYVPEFFVKEWRVIMKFLPFLPVSAKRVLICIKRALPKALSLETAVMLFNSVTFYLSDKDGSISYLLMLKWLVILFFICWIFAAVVQLSRYYKNFFHRYDDEIIGKAFTGLNRKSAIFEKGLELFHNNDFRLALEIFTDLDDEKYLKTQQEQGVVSFYRGRCYDIMGAFPNALMCYEKAVENNFRHDIMPLLIAKTSFENGDTQRAVDIYKGLLDSERENRYERIVRTSLGHIYLKTGDSETALKWFQDAIDRHENYAEALAGAAIAQTTLHNFEEGDKLYRLALINNIENSENFTNYYKEIQAAALLESDYTIAK